MADTAFHSLTSKGTVVAADELLLGDSAASWETKRTTVSILLAYLNTLVITDTFSVVIANVTDKDYKLIVKCPFGGTITEVTTICASGTATATTKINTTALGGTANSVSSSEQSQAHSSSNVFVAGDDIVVTASSSSSCLDMTLTIKYTRTLGLA